MALKVKPVLTCFLFIWLSFIQISGFVAFNEEKRIGSFNKNARSSTESFDPGDEQLKSGKQVGRLFIWQDKDSNPYGDGSNGFASDLGFQSGYDENTYRSDDPGWINMQPHWSQVYGLKTLNTPRVERLLGMKPTVDCVGDLMKLTVHGHEASFGSNFLIARGNSPPLPLSQLPSECGHRFLRTWRDFVFTVPFDGCYVLQERDAFVLPLLWWGLPIKMSCSSLTSSRRPPTVSCYTNGMIVRLHSGVSENLKIKVKNEWKTPLKVSARCGYSLVSHPEGVVIHAPYMPCTEPKDGMFTLNMATNREFNLSCPALSLHLAPKNDISTSIPFDLISSTLPPTTITTTETTQPTTSSTTQKLPSPLGPYLKPDQTDFKPVHSSNPLVRCPPKIPPTVIPQGPKIVGFPTAVTKGPQVHVYTKHPPAWYPSLRKPFRLTPDTSQSASVPYYQRVSILKPTKAHDSKANIVSELKPISIPQKPTVPHVQWESSFPPSNLVYALYPGKPGFVASSSAGFSHHPQTQPRPPEPQSPLRAESAPPIPAPTRKTRPQPTNYQWSKPFPSRLLEVPIVPAKVPAKKAEEVVKPQASACPHQSVVEGPPKRRHFFTPSTDPSHSPPKSPEVVHTPAPIMVPIAPISSSHAHSFHCPTFCPGPPSVSYHHHDHHHFSHPLPTSKLNMLSLTKITEQTLSSPGRSTGLSLFPFIQDTDYNYWQTSSKGAAVPPTSDNTEKQFSKESLAIKGTGAPDTSNLFAEPTLSPYIFRKFQPAAASAWSKTKPSNFAPVTRPLRPFKLLSRPLQGPVAEPLVYPDQKLNPAVYHSEVQQFIPPWGHHMAPMSVAPNNVPSEKMVQHDISSKPTMHTSDGKNVYVNYWYEATSNAKPFMTDSPTKDSFNQIPLHQPSNNHDIMKSSTQPERIHGMNPSMQLTFHPLMQNHNSVPVMNSHLFYPQSEESVTPVFRDPKFFSTYWIPAAQPKQDA